MLNIKHISKDDTKFHHGLMFVVIDKYKIHFINQSTSKYYVKFIYKGWIKSSGNSSIVLK